ncbi:MAG: VWA domain-containing protein [Planctomycetia bacterium]
MSALLERIAGLVLRSPGVLALGLPLLGVAGLCVLMLRRWRRAAALPVAALAPTALVPAAGPDDATLPASWRTRLVHLPATLAVLGLVLLLVVLARPAARVAHARPVEGLDLLLVLDTSSSMTTRGPDGLTRLAHAQQAAREFIAARAHDRIGLVAFARYPELLCPPTRDHAALAAQLAALRPVAPDGPEDATASGAAAALAADALAASPQGSAARVVVLLTDGEENVALEGQPGEVAPAHAAQLAQRLGVRVHVIATGTGARGAPGAGRPAPDLAPVRAMAVRTGGRLLEAGDARALGEAYAAIDRLERSAVPEPELTLEDRPAAFLALALLLLLAARLLAAGPLAVHA